MHIAHCITMYTNIYEFIINKHQLLAVADMSKERAAVPYDSFFYANAFRANRDCRELLGVLPVLYVIYGVLRLNECILHRPFGIMLNSADGGGNSIREKSL